MAHPSHTGANAHQQGLGVIACGWRGNPCRCLVRGARELLMGSFNPHFQRVRRCPLRLRENPAALVTQASFRAAPTAVDTKEETHV
jgi:hypothetical protein